MSNKEIFIDVTQNFQLVAVREDGKLVDLFFDFDSKNDFYPYRTHLLAKVTRNIGKHGFIINLPNKKTGFLSTRKKYGLGEMIIVRAKHFFDKDKLQRFSDIFLYRTKFFIFKFGNRSLFFSKKLDNKWIDCFPKEKIFDTLNKTNQRISVIFRSRVMELNIDSILIKFSEKLEEVTKIIENLKSGCSNELIYSCKDHALDMYNGKEDYRITEEKGIFDTVGIWDQVDRYHQERFSFSNGCNLIIQQTAAFCAIDVNTGTEFKKKVEDINLEACSSIVNNIKVRGIGGKIIIDFMPTNSENRSRITERLIEMFSSDPILTRIHGWTKGNNFEIERERSKLPLSFLKLQEQ